MIYDAQGRKIRRTIGFLGGRTAVVDPKTTPVDAIACQYVDVTDTDREANRSAPDEA